VLTTPQPAFRRTVCRPTGSNPFHQSRDPLAVILPLFPRRVQLPIPLGLNLLLMPGEHVLWRDVADGTVHNAHSIHHGIHQGRTKLVLGVLWSEPSLQFSSEIYASARRPSCQANNQVSEATRCNHHSCGNTLAAVIESKTGYRRYSSLYLLALGELLVYLILRSIYTSFRRVLRRRFLVPTDETVTMGPRFSLFVTAIR